MREVIYFRIEKNTHIQRNGHYRKCVEYTKIYEFSSIESAQAYAQRYSDTQLVWFDDDYELGGFKNATISKSGEKIEFSISKHILPEVLSSDSPLIDLSKPLDHQTLY